MRSVAVVMLGLVALVASDNVGITGGLDGAYYCVTEVAGGLSYDSSQKAWSGTSFRADTKFVLRIAFIDTKRIAVPVAGEQETVPLDSYRYQVKITKAGTDQTVYCDNHRSIGAPEQHIVSANNDRGILWCTTDDYEFGFDLETKRFEMVYMSFGYAGWRPEFAGVIDKPPQSYVAGGTCTKIE